jgi:hypothetical protein
MTKCGKAYCACASDPTKRHGPYFELTYKVDGKTVNVRLSPEAAPLYQAASLQFRKLKALLARLDKLSKTILRLQPNWPNPGNQDWALESGLSPYPGSKSPSGIGQISLIQ